MIEDTGNLHQSLVVTAHIVFDVKYDGRKRVRMVAGGHLTEPSNDVAYCGIALLKTIRAVLFIGVLNGLVMCAYDIRSAYLEAFTRKKLYIIAGPEFKDLEGHTLLVNKALYGLRTSGACWAETLADYSSNFGRV